jgi:hypothetical protein
VHQSLVVAREVVDHHPAAHRLVRIGLIDDFEIAGTELANEAPRARQGFDVALTLLGLTLPACDDGFVAWS